MSLRQALKDKDSRYIPSQRPLSTNLRKSGSIDLGTRSHLSKLDSLTKLELMMRHGRISESIKEDITSYEARHLSEQSKLVQHEKK